MTSPLDEQVRVYEQLCNSYRAIDDFRAKLLGFLPLATGTGVFLLITDRAKIEFIQGLFPPIGFFGLVITLGLFFYELYGIKKCTSIIKAGKAIENQLNVPNGQFTQRPPGVGFFINEPLASGVIYPAVMAAWIFLAFAFPQPHAATVAQPQDSLPFIFSNRSESAAIVVFLTGFAFSFFYNLTLLKDDIKTAANLAKGNVERLIKPSQDHKH